MVFKEKITNQSDGVEKTKNQSLAGAKELGPGHRVEWGSLSLIKRHGGGDGDGEGDEMAMRWRLG